MSSGSRHGIFAKSSIEQVFAEQEEVLRRDDRLDLEVQIEVLETQLKREGIH